MRRVLAMAAAIVTAAACSGGRAPAAVTAERPARNLLLITIDTLRADHVGAYGYRRARTPALDALAARGVRFDHAYAAAPITLVSHASLLTGKYPPGHGARHNGMRMDLATPTLAETLGRDGFATAGFISAFPLDRRFGLIKGFQTYGDDMPRGPDGRPANERPGRITVDQAIAWLGDHRDERFFLWVHLFEPHAPYGNPDDPAEARRPAIDRYDDDIAEADRQVGRLLAELKTAEPDTLVVAASDHGEAFGEHGEISHSLFAYDTTLRVPLIVAGPGIEPRVVTDPVCLIDVVPTVLAKLSEKAMDTDGIDLSPALAGTALKARPLYAETFAPLLDFGWSPLRTLRADDWKYIAAPEPELYNVKTDPGETTNHVSDDATRASAMARRVDAMAPAQLAPDANVDASARARLQALGYLGGARSSSVDRPDPKERRELAARIAQVTSGELHGAALEKALAAIVHDDPRNPQANLRLGYALADKDQCAEAVPHFETAIAAGLPSVDAHLGLASCQVTLKNPAAAIRTLSDAEQIEPGNPVVSANLGLVLSDSGNPKGGIPHLERALTLDPDLHQARFALAIAYARNGQRADAAREAEELLRRLPADAPQRPEVERLLTAVR
jgi:arylsulfatase A-like enzyme